MAALGQVSARSQGRTLVVTACLYCGKSLSLLQRWLGADRHFCSIPHRDLYKQEQTRLAIKVSPLDHTPGIGEPPISSTAEVFPGFSVIRR